MKVSSTSIPDVLVIEPRVFTDQRGFFLETYNRDRYQAEGITANFVQDNHARSTLGVLRGLHFQKTRPQAKLVWVIEGEVYDVVVDIRKGSPTFGKWEGFTLTAESRKQVYIPEGFAHGYCVISETAELVYKCSDFYHPEDEGGLLWNDPDLGIEWPVKNPILSEKDARYPGIKSLSG